MSGSSPVGVAGHPDIKQRVSSTFQSWIRAGFLVAVRARAETRPGLFVGNMINERLCITTPWMRSGTVEPAFQKSSCLLKTTTRISHNRDRKFPVLP